MDVVDELKAAIDAYRQRGGTVYGLAKESGVVHPILSRFLAGRRTITIETAAKLCTALGLHLVKARGTTKGRKG